MKKTLTAVMFSCVTLTLTTTSVVTYAATETNIASAAGGPMSQCPALLKFMKRKLNSQETVNLCQEYSGKTILFVNTASYCGFTPQFEGLETLYNNYKDKGLVVLGFPSHDFNQEDNDEGKTAELCELTYGVKFPMFEPIAVRGDDVDPLYRMLAKKSGTTPKWNFYKYLVGKDGEVIDSYSSFTKPDDSDLIEAIEKSLSI